MRHVARAQPLIFVARRLGAVVCGGYWLSDNGKVCTARALKLTRNSSVLAPLDRFLVAFELRLNFEGGPKV